MRDKPLHVQVAEALQVKSVSAEWGYPGPPEEGSWSHERSRLFQTKEEAESAHKARNFEVPGEHFLCYWKDGWGPLIIDEYDTDWNPTGPLIEKYRLAVAFDNPTKQWTATFDTESLFEPMLPRTGETPLIAVCHLILALHAAGKLNEEKP